jgi:hypothetical protein
MNNQTAPTVFISFGGEDVDSANRLSADLRQAGLSPWLHHERLSPGDDWRESIRRAIQGSDYFVTLLSSRSVNRKGYMHWELYQALDQLTLFPPGQIYLVPVRLDECDVAHARLTNLHRVDLFPDWPTGLAQLMTAFHREPESPRAQHSKVTTDAPKASYLQLSDVQTIPDRLTKTCMLDLRVVNTGASEVLINRVKLTVDELLPGTRLCWAHRNSPRFTTLTSARSSMPVTPLHSA